LPLLVLEITAKHSRFMTERLVPTSKPEDPLLVPGELI